MPARRFAPFGHGTRRKSFRREPTIAWCHAQARRGHVVDLEVRLRGAGGRTCPRVASLRLGMAPGENRFAASLRLPGAMPKPGAGMSLIWRFDCEVREGGHARASLRSVWAWHQAKIVSPRAYDCLVPCPSPARACR